MYFFLSNFTVWDIDGADGRKFLNGLLTQNIQKISLGNGCHSLVCSSQGRIQADLHCFAFSEFFRIETSMVFKKEIQNYFVSRIIMEDVRIEDGVHEWGADSHQGLFVELSSVDRGSLQIPIRLYQHVYENNLWIVRRNFFGIDGLEIWGRTDEINSLANQFQSQLNESALDEASQEILRIESITPKFGVDFGKHSLPQEVNLYDALSFDKGCYVGQETIARLQHRGHVNKTLVLLKLENNVQLESGDKVYGDAGQEIGNVTSFCVSPKYEGLIAMGVIRTEAIQSKAMLFVKNIRAEIII